MDLLTIIFIGVVLSLLLHYILSDPRIRCNAPGPISLPFLGSYLSVQLPLWRWMHKIGRKYGSVIKVQMPDQLYVVVNSYKEIREVFENDVFLGRPDFPGRKQIFGKKGGGLSLSEGKQWRNHRRFSIRALKDLGFGRPSCESQMQLEVELVIEKIKTMRDNDTEKEGLDVHEDIYEAVCNVIATLIFGRRIASEDKEFKENLVSIQYLTQENQMRLPIMIVSKILKECPALLDHIPFERIKNMIQGKFQEVLVYIQEQIELKRKQNCHLNNQLDVAKEYDNYIDMYLAEKMAYFSDDEVDESGEDNPLLRDGCLAMTIFDLITGGTDTIANAVNWSLLMSALHPELQEELHKELDTAAENGIPISFCEKRHFSFCEAFMEEVHRHITLLPLGVIRRATKTTTIGNYVIPRNTWVVCNLHGLHHDETIFDDPDIFNPHRYISETGSFQPLREALPFSLGKRGCPGENLARVEQFVIFANIIKSYTIGLPQETEQRLPEILRGTDGIVRAPLKHKLHFTPRAHSEATVTLVNSLAE